MGFAPVKHSGDNVSWQKIMRIRSSGFTFFEIIIVFGLMITFTVLGGIGVIQLHESFTLKSSADEIRSLLALAREQTLANLDNTSYRVNLNSNIVALQTASGVEQERVQVPTSVTFTPSSLTWSYLPATGEISGCTAPCQLTLTQGGATEIIRITQSGIIE